MPQSNPPKSESLGSLGSPRKIAKRLQSSALLQGLANAGSSGIKTISKSIPFGQKRQELLDEGEGTCDEGNKDILEQSPKYNQEDVVWKRTSTTKQVDDKLSALEDKKRRRELQREALYNHQSPLDEGFVSNQNIAKGSEDTASNVEEFPLSMGYDEAKRTTSKQSTDVLKKNVMPLDVPKFHATSERHLNSKTSDLLFSNDDNGQSKKKDLHERRRRYKTAQSERVLHVSDSAPTQEPIVSKEKKAKKTDRSNLRASRKVENTPEDNISNAVETTRQASRAKKSTGNTTIRRRTSFSASAGDQTAAHAGISGNDKNPDAKFIKQNNQSWSSESNLSVSDGSDRIENNASSSVTDKKKVVQTTNTPSIRRRSLLQARKEQSMRAFNLSPKKSPQTPRSPRRSKIQSKTNTFKTSIKDATDDIFVNEKANESFSLDALVIVLDDESSKDVGGSISVDDLVDSKASIQSHNSQRSLNKSQLLRSPSRRVRKPMHLAKDRAAGSRGLHGQCRSTRQLTVEDGDADDGEKRKVSKGKKRSNAEKANKKHQIPSSSRRGQLQKSLSMSSIVESESKPSIELGLGQLSKRDFLTNTSSATSLHENDNTDIFDYTANKDNRRDLLSKSSSAKSLTEIRKNMSAKVKTKESGEETNFRDTMVRNDPDNDNKHLVEASADAASKGISGKNNFLRSLLTFRSASSRALVSNESKEVANVDIVVANTQESKSNGFSSLVETQRKTDSITHDAAEGLSNPWRRKNQGETRPVATSDTGLEDGVIVNKKPFSEESYIYKTNTTVTKDQQTPIFGKIDTEEVEKTEDGRQITKSLSLTSSQRHEKDQDVLQTMRNGNHLRSKKSEASIIVIDKDGNEKGQNIRKTTSSQARRKVASTRYTSVEGDQPEDITDKKRTQDTVSSMDESTLNKSNRHNGWKSKW
jgi:hypothetical protein